MVRPRRAAVRRDPNQNENPIAAADVPILRAHRGSFLDEMKRAAADARARGILLDIVIFFTHPPGVPRVPHDRHGPLMPQLVPAESDVERFEQIVDLAIEHNREITSFVMKRLEDRREAP
ncbi:unnamed protein product [Caenorhabditis sp. 36 PRJEB53466]|nr:unnamed protein product [Caenorhabditis sp. 36 PRJEB53466]